LALTLVLAESAIELVPNQITGHSTVKRSALKKNKDPRRLILDQSYHHAAILRLEGGGVGRGRPDIAHLALLLALGSPLNMEGELRCFVHTRDDHVITVNPHARLPRNTDRFTSLLEQLYEKSAVPSSGTPLMSLRRESLTELLEALSSELVVALTMQGTPKPLQEVASEQAKAKKPVVLVGGFPKGHFSRNTTEAYSRKYQIDRRPLEAWTVVARTIYEYENAIGLSRF
jgi:rRNA small subunit pseudouridine methyltransferase Nep1